LKVKVEVQIKVEGVRFHAYFRLQTPFLLSFENEHFNRWRLRLRLRFRFRIGLPYLRKL